MGRVRALVVATVVVAGSIGGVGPAALTAAPAGAVVNPTPTIDPTNRASVWAAYQSSLVEAQAVPVGWTGNASTCTEGTESAASIAATRAAVNFYRGLVGLPNVGVADSTANLDAMRAALLMTANPDKPLTHFPDPSYTCWTQARDDAAENHNLATTPAAQGVQLFMVDPGDSNDFAGHRSWILHPRGTTIATGSTSSHIALDMQTGGSVPAGVDWIAWPNEGFVPKAIIQPYVWWTKTLFSLTNAAQSLDYSLASVTVKVGSTTLPVEIRDRNNQLTWYTTLPADWGTTGDVKLDITVSGIKNSGGMALVPHAYSSTAIVSGSTATVPGAPTGVGATAGNGQATVSWTAPTSNGGSDITGYKVTPYIGATAQPVRTFTGTATSRVVTGLTNGTAYTFRVQAVNAVGDGALSSPSGAVTPTAPAAPYAPYSSWSHLVDQVFRQLIGRSPTTAERNQWLGPLQNGTLSPGDLVASLRQSSHHRNVVDQITRLYRAYYLRIPDRGGLEYWIAQRLGGRSMVSISAFFARNAEFVALYGNLTHRQFVEQIYLNILGRPGEAAGITYWTDEITSGRRGRGEVMLGFSESAEYRTAQASEVTVSVLYILWLDRAPTTSELDAGVAALDGGQSVADYADTLRPHAAVLP